MANARLRPSVVASVLPGFGQSASFETAKGHSRCMADFSGPDIRLTNTRRLAYDSCPLPLLGAFTRR